MADIFGRNAVREALRAGQSIHRLEIAKGTRHGVIDEIIALAKDAGVPLSIVERKVLDRRFPGQNHQGVAATLPEVDYVDLDAILARAGTHGEAPLLVICDEIEDPHNLGAILRNADAFGAHGVLIGKRRSAGLSEGAIKSAAGAAAHVPVARIGNLPQTMDRLKKAGFWICGSAADGSSMYDCDLKGPLAIVIGNEGRGMGRLVREHCDFTAAIPMGGAVGSLNASVAAGILLCEAARQRSGS